MRVSVVLSALVATLAVAAAASAGGWATVAVAKFRCDGPTDRGAVTFDVTLPGLRTATLGPVTRGAVSFCPDESRPLTMTAVKASYR